MQEISVDVVIPSYRLKGEYLSSILSMEKPPESQTRYLIIADNPGAEVPAEIEARVDGEHVVLLRNETNLGAGMTRNVGIDHATADWILFLDDDVKPVKNLLKTYCAAIRENPDEIGFMGETRFPEPVNSYTKGLIAAGMLYFFNFARYNERSRFAPTSNVMVNRHAVGDIRFDEIYPKKGGGEDFAFFMELSNKTEKALKCLGDAIVHHPWWSDGHRNYRQFMRWTYADVFLYQRHPEVTYRNFPNIIEGLAIGGLISIGFSIYTGSLLPLLCTVFGILVADLFVEWVMLFFDEHKRKYLWCFGEVVLIKAFCDLGRFYGQIVKLRFGDICKRTNYSNHEVDWGFRQWPAIKFFLYIVASLGAYFLLRYGFFL